MMRSKRLRFRLACMVLALCFLVPLFVPSALAAVPETVQITVPGLTPDEVDALALDPQTWRLPNDTKFNPAVLSDGTVLNESPDWDGYESFVPFPIVDWEQVRQGDAPGSVFPQGMSQRIFRGAIVLIEFPDRPLISSLPLGSEIMGNPQIDTGISQFKGEERGKALVNFWREFLNESRPELNRSHNITGGWLEYSAGQMMLDLEVFGPFTMPYFQFQYPAMGTWWDTGTTSYTNFGNFDFRTQFPKAGALATAAAQTAWDAGVPFYDPATGDARFNFIFFMYAGYCQSPTWQEMGSMMFPSPYLDENGNPININGNFGFGATNSVKSVRPSVVDTTIIRDPVTRDVVPGVTGLDFTGYGHMQRIIDTITAPGFDITVEWPTYNRSNLEATWRTFVSTGTNLAAFTSARTAFEGPDVTVPTSITLPDGRTVSVSGTAAQRLVGANVADAYTAFRAEYPTATWHPQNFRDNVLRPAFLRQYAEGLKYAATAPAFQPVAPATAGLALAVEPETPALTQGDIAWIDGTPYYNGHVFLGDVDKLPESFLIAPEFAEWADNYIDPPAAYAPFAFASASLSAAQDDPAYSQMWLDFAAANNSASIVAGLLPLLEAAKAEAAANTRNPYYQAAPSRYVPWTSWYGGCNVWSHASSLSIATPWGNRTLSFSAQGEGTSMGTYSHELGHIVSLPDNDNMVYQEIPVRPLLGGWDMMARGAHVGYFGGHARWSIPGVRSGSAGTGVMMRSRVMSGFTDLTTQQSNGRHWVRTDHENSKDILYVPYNEFRAGPPVFAELYGRNIPANRGFSDAEGAPIEGYVGIIIEDTRATINRAYNTSGALIANHGQVLFTDRTPGVTRPIFGTNTTNTIQTRWGNNILGVDLNYPAPNTTPAVPLTAANGRAYLATLPTNPITGFVSIDPLRWNWTIGGNVSTQTVSAATSNTGLNSGTNSPRQGGFTVEVIERAGHDSFCSDHGVLISRTAHTNIIGVGNIDSPGSYIMDSHPGNLGLVQFREADGTPFMMWDDHHATISTAAFHAGTHNSAEYYRDIYPERFHELDNRPGVAGDTVNEWIDAPNEFHFYVLARNNHEGNFGPFLSYEVAVRNMAADAWKADGELKLAAVGGPLVPAQNGNFAAQTYSLTNTGADTDIVRITLGGKLAETVYLDDAKKYAASTKEQNAVLLNNLYAIGAGETIEFDVFVKTGTGLLSDFDLTVTASSETNSAKTASADLEILLGVWAIVDTNEQIYCGDPIPYTVSLVNAEDVGTVKVSFTVDTANQALDLRTAVTPLNGFTFLKLDWADLGGGVWKGTALLMYPGFVTSAAPIDCLKITTTALNTVADVSIELSDFVVTGDLYGLSAFKPSAIAVPQATTSIVNKTPIYLKYDLNHDGKIDILDTNIAVFFYLKSSTSAGWATDKFDIATAQDADVNGSGRVDLADLIEIMANYRASYDLFPY